MANFDYTQLTKADILKLLEERHGVVYGDVSKISKASLIDRINDLEGITAPQPLGEQAVNEASPQSGAKQTRLVSVVVNIHVGETLENQQDVFVGVDGKTYQIQRGKNATVPVAVYEVLKNAVETSYTQERDPITNKMTLRGVESLRYPFSTIEKIYK